MQIVGQNAISASGQSCRRCVSSFERSCIRARCPSARNGANHRAVTRGDPSVVEQQASVEVAVAEFPSAAPGRFINGNTAFVQEFPVRGYEVSPNQRASMVTVANLLQVRTQARCACMLEPHLTRTHSMPYRTAGAGRQPCGRYVGPRGERLRQPPQRARHHLRHDPAADTDGAVPQGEG